MTGSYAAADRALKNARELLEHLQQFPLMRQWLQDQVAASAGTGRIPTRSVTALAYVEDNYEQIVGILEQLFQFVPAQGEGQQQAQMAPELPPQEQEAPAAAAVIEQMKLQPPAAAEQEVWTLFSRLITFLTLTGTRCRRDGNGSGRSFRGGGIQFSLNP